MRFIDFAAAHGLDIRSLEQGRIARCPTKDHPGKRNGAYLFDGEWGWVQSWETMLEPEYWKDDSIIEPHRVESLRVRMEASRKQHNQDRAKESVAASKRAQAIITAAKQEQHAYLDSKGWRDTGLVWYPAEDINLLVIPMRIAGTLAGCQLIDRDGSKKFLKGQRTNGAEYVFGTRGVDVWCEGYATARSLNECLSMSGAQARVHACFSAGNLQRMAKTGIVIADNDASQTGEKAARATGLPYWMPDRIGQDFNDYHQERGTFPAGMALRKFLQSVRNGAHPKPGARETEAVRA